MSAPTAAAPSGVAEVGVGRPGLDHVPALDGIRALAVVAVLLFHGQMPWATGGFLGVSVFFTLSGFLITSLLMGEHRHSGGVDLRRFWGRRFRRLAPASLALLLTLLAVGWVTGISERVVDDIRAAAFYVANWWAIHTGASYADVFASPSPTEHFWSLAIEEQFYAVFPVVVWLTLRRAAPSRAAIRLGVVLGSMWVGSVALGFIYNNPDRIYLGTTTRAAELLTGALLAIWWPIRARTQRPLRPVESAAGFGALAVLAALCWRTTITSSWLYNGGLPAVSLVSATLVAIATRPGPLSRVLAWKPLVHIGAISYGVYLFHWPVFMWLDQRRIGWSLGPLLVLRLAVTFALAELSFRLLERPIRLKRLLPGRSAVVAFCVAMAALLITSAVVPTQIDDREALASILDGDTKAQLGLTSPTEPTAAPSSSPPQVTVPPIETTTTVPGPPVIAFAGDSVPAVLATEIGSLGADEFGVQILNLGIEGCDGARGAPQLRYAGGRTFTEAPICTQWEQTWPALFGQFHPKAVLFMLGSAAVLDRDLNGQWTNPCHGDFRAWYSAEVLHRIDWLTANTSARPVLATSPWAEFGTLGLPQKHQERTDCLNSILDEVARQRPGLARVDLRGFVCPDGPRGCLPLRGDGLHYRDEGASTLARWLIPQVLAAVPPPAPPTTTAPP